MNYLIVLFLKKVNIKITLKILFVANDGIHGSELWITDGTEEGTYMIKDVREGSTGSSSGYFVLLE